LSGVGGCRGSMWATMTLYMGLASTFGFLSRSSTCVFVKWGRVDGSGVDMEEVEELFEALNDAGIVLGFGGDSCTNIPNPLDPDDSGWHLMIRKGVLDGRWETFRRVLEERGLDWKHEEFLGRRHVSVYRPGYRFPGWVSNMVKT
jgi:hypothetical protein